ncbi:MAG TPA: type II toxin-antitoxin system RelE/ParE family toxin [Desulfobacteraceae bacterium]|nr:type II toxin-antitoxin system RelE/ParE family toxin [Desulfobacteraceae bacterium]
MNYKIEFTAVFKRRIKKLSKKYPHIKQDFSDILDQLEKGRFQGDEVQGFQGKVYKVRIASSDQKKGKSGGFRFIYYIVFQNETVYMMTAYAKSAQETLTNRQKEEIRVFIAAIHKST